jgi:hypothetical protein
LAALEGSGAAGGGVGAAGGRGRYAVDVLRGESSWIEYQT